MTYLEMTNSDGSAIYFDVYATEQGDHGLIVSGTIGDGAYEGDVSIELGRVNSVTFADAWLGGDGLNEFLDRCSAEGVKQALINTARELYGGPLRRADRYSEAYHGASQVAEAKTLWKGVA